MGASELTLFGRRGATRRRRGKGVSGEEAKSAAAKAAAEAAADGDGSEEGSEGGSEDGEGGREDGSEESSGESSDDDEDGGEDGMSVDGDEYVAMNAGKIKMPREEKVAVSPDGSGRTRRRALFDDDGDDRMGQQNGEEGACVSTIRA